MVLKWADGAAMVVMPVGNPPSTSPDRIRFNAGMGVVAQSLTLKTSDSDNTLTSLFLVLAFSLLSKSDMATP